MCPRAKYRAAWLVLGLGWLASTVPVSAQAGGFAIDRFEPSERGSEWFALDTLHIRGHLTPAAGVVADYGYKPLILRDQFSDEVGQLVKHQLFFHLGGSVVLWNRLRLGANLPLSPAVRGDGVSAAPQYRVNEGAALGDFRLSADARVFGKYRGPLTGALGVSFWLPSGTRSAFAGRVRVLGAPRLQLSRPRRVVRGIEARQ